MRRQSVLAAFIVLLATIPLSFSQYGYGTSSVSFANSSVSIAPGTSASVDFTIALATGSPWGTTANIANAAQLSSEGIAVSAKPSYGDPTYSGAVTITVSSSTAPGTYTVSMNATGDDPSSNTASLTVLVPSPSAPSNSTQTHNSANVTTQPTVSVGPTVAPKSPTTTSHVAPSGAPNYGAYDASAVIVVVIAIVVAFMAFRKR